MASRTRIELLPEYTEPFWPLWRVTPRDRGRRAVAGGDGPLTEDDLPLSTDLKNRIKAWLNAWAEASWAKPSWPTWQPPPGVDSRGEVQELWRREGETIRESIEAELGDEFEVIFEPLMHYL